MVFPMVCHPNHRQQNATAATTASEGRWRPASRRARRSAPPVSSVMSWKILRKPGGRWRSMDVPIPYMFGLFFRPKFYREYPQNSYGQTYGTFTVPPSIGSWRSPIDSKGFDGGSMVVSAFRGDLSKRMFGLGDLMWGAMDDKGVIDFCHGIPWNSDGQFPRISTFSDYSSCGLKNGGSQHGTEGLPKNTVAWRV